MATVKILDLPFISTLQANTANTVLVGQGCTIDKNFSQMAKDLRCGLSCHNLMAAEFGAHKKHIEQWACHARCQVKACDQKS